MSLPPASDVPSGDDSYSPQPPSIANVSSAVNAFEAAMKQASETGLVASRSNRRPLVRLSMVGCSSPLPTLPEIPASPLIIATSRADRSDDVLSARPATISQSSTPHEQVTSYDEWDPILEVDSHGQSVSKHNQSDNKSCDALKPVQTQKRALPVRKVSTGKLAVTNKVRPIFTGIENERKLPSMRFSPTLSPVRPRRPLLEGPTPKSRLALGPMSPKSPAPAAAKTASTPKTKSQSRTLLIRRPRSSMSGISTKSKIPIPVSQVDTQVKTLDPVESAADALIPRLLDEHDEVSPTISESNSSLGSSIVVVVSPTDSTTSVVTDVTNPDTPAGIEEEVLEYGVSRPAGYIHGVKVETLQALGYHDPVFRDEKAFLDDFPSLLEQLESRHFEGDVQYDLVGVKLKELGERIAVVNTMYHDAKRTGAPENEIMCITGWGEDLLRETSKIQKTEVKYHKAWVRHVVDWLWDIENMKTGAYDDQKDTTEKPTQPANHPLFNLVETTKELIRGGFNGKEKDVVLLWADIRGIPLLASACGKMVIHEYVTRLARWDGCKLERHAIQERRMHYFCLRHYKHWKSAVSQYNLALKMMNLLIIFHDLWGMHVDGMSMQERNDYSLLHDNLYNLACQFERPNQPDEDSVWKGNECYYCFCKTASDPLDHSRSKSLWYWLLLLSGVIGYGSYHSALLQTMTAGKSPEYVNRLLDTTYYTRQASMMMAVKRIAASIRKQAKVGTLIRPLGTGYNKFLNPVPASLR